MRNLIIWVVTAMVIWMFPARWGANFFFPEMMAQFSGQVPWLMAWGVLMFLLSMFVMAIVGHD